MQFVAYYIDWNEFGIKNQTINFGGKYSYNLIKKSERKVEIKRNLNPKYIPNFYSDKNLTLLSAVVGRNGTGKTSFLIDIIKCISGDRGSDSILIFEEKEKVLLFFGNTDEDNGVRGNVGWSYESTEYFKIEILDKNIGSIYYSPHLDHRESVPGVDLSFDKLLSGDLEEERNVDRFTNSLNPIKQHEFNNFKRQAAFISSEISHMLYEEFKLPKPNEKLKISFSVIGRLFTDTGYREFKNFNNFPTDFKNPLNEILRKCEEESNSKRRGGEVVYQKERLKHYIIWGILSIIVEVGEANNAYLEEGRLPEDYFKKTKDLNAIDTFQYFIKEHYYVKSRSKVRLDSNPIPKVETNELTNRLFSIIDDLKAQNYRDTKNFDWGHRCIYPSVQDAFDLIKLEAFFKGKLERYYQPAYTKRERIEPVTSLIQPEWHDRMPSSGENAILNLFSRLNSIAAKINSSEIKFYILFLDEGDAGFHPEWKKKYVEILVKILPELFKKNGIQFQVIFTTHDPLTLSDVLNYNIIYLDKKEGESHSVLDYNDSNRPQNSFAANISDLLNDSFFIGDGLIGDFSKRKIKETIDWLNSKVKKNDTEDYYLKLIRNIDEQIVQRKLSEMYDEEMNTNTELQILDEQIKELLNKKDKLKK